VYVFAMVMDAMSVTGVMLVVFGIDGVDVLCMRCVVVSGT
jgi:hypothetical protein